MITYYLMKRAFAGHNSEPILLWQVFCRGDATKSTAEAGRDYIEAMANAMARTVREKLAE